MRNYTHIDTRFLENLYRWVRKEVQATRVPKKIVYMHGDGVEVNATAVHGLLHIKLPERGVEDREMFFLLVVHLAAVLRPERVPPGDLGVYRQQIAKTFNDNADKLMARWAGR